MTQPAVTLARDALGRPYAQATFLRLANELLNQLTPREVPLPVDGGRFADAITSARLLATATLADRSALHVLAVELPRGATVERARTLQRDFVARHLKDHAAEAALAAFYTPGEDSWRLSLVTLATDATVTDAGVATRLVASPAKRYSYLVGPSELTRTAEEQLLPLLADTTSVPTLAQLEAAFAVEPVSEEFYASYREHYLTLKEDLERLIAAPEVASEFQQRGITAEGFAKRLMGQLVFLYFLQRKGWLGVPEGGAWGAGPKDFIKRLRRGEYFTIDNLYNDALEPLFYEALAKPEGSPAYRAVGLRFPFLNGGLFEAYRGYDWRRLRLPIPNATLEAVLDTLDAYNFTVREDHPLEQEVAVDPEMLGRVFERLLDVRERKHKGAHYTRREIVHYMVQDTLIAHITSLATPPASTGGLFDQLTAPLLHPALAGVTPEALRTFFLTGDPSRLATPEELPRVAAALDAALRDMRVLDPAIGSGAFPLGFLNEVTRAREALTPLLPNTSNRSQYDLKRETIENSIYGVDIEPSAVDISKLRLWLSLVVDEDDADGIEPLPNLDYKILTGNSLYTSEGLILDQGRLRALEALKQEFFSETDLPRKQELRKRIDTLLTETLEEAKRVSNIADFDVRLVFSEVFTGPRKGFDAVIGNPPYVRIQNLRKADPDQVEYLRSRYFSAKKHNFDLYVVFVEAGLKLLHDRGHLAFILPHKFFNAQYGENLRTLLSNKRHLRKIVHFGHHQMFKNASTYVCLLFLSADPNEAFEFTDASDGAAWLKTQTGPSMTLPASEAGTGFWVFRVGPERHLLEHLKTFPLTLGRITSRISQGIRTSGNPVYVLNRTATPGRYYSEHLDETVELEDTYLNRFLAGSTLDPYTPPQTDQVVILPYTVNNGRATLVPEDTLRQTAPKTHAYLLRCKDFLENREEGKMRTPQWYGYVYPKNLELMRSRKILVPDMAASAAFTYDPDGRYALVSGYGITLNHPNKTDELYLLGLLNSSVLDFYIRMNSTPLQGGYYRYFTQFLKPMPLPTLDPKNERHTQLKQEVAAHAQRLLELHDDQAGDTSGNAAEIAHRLTCIDDIAIELYGLTPELVAILRGSKEG